MIKNIAIGILFLFLLYFLFFRPKEVVKEIVTKEVKEYVNAEVDRVNNKIDKDGFEHAVNTEVRNLTKDDVLNDSSNIWKNKYLEQLNINEDQAILLTTYRATISGLNLAAKKTDSSFRYSDAWTKIEFVKSKDSLGTGHFNFYYDAEINYAEYYKRDWFLGKKKHYVDFWIADSRATINGVKRVKFKPKEDRIKLDINASGFYTDRLNLGADAGISIDRTRIGAGYYYDVQERKWRPVVSLKFKILDL